MVNKDQKEKCGCCVNETANKQTDMSPGPYICYCSKVTEEDIRQAVRTQGAASVAAVIEITGAMTNSNCWVNNPKGTCCYPDIEAAYLKCREESERGTEV